MRRPALLGTLTALLLAGCGAASLSTQELQNQASRLCTAARQQTDKIPAPPSPAGGGAFLARGIAVLDPELKSLRRLQPPREVAQVYSTSITAFSRKLEALRSASASLTQGADPVVAMRALQDRIAPLETEEDGAWQALGITACLNH